MKVSKVIRSPQVLGQRKLNTQSHKKQPEHHKKDEAVAAEEEAMVEDSELPAIAASGSELVQSLQQRIVLLESELTELETRNRQLLSELDESKARRQQIEEQGYEDGLSRGREEAQKELNAAQSQFLKCTEIVNGWRKESIQQLDETVIEVAFSLWVKLVGKAYPEPEFVKELTRNALSHAGETNSLTVYVNQKDYDQLSADVRELIENRAVVTLKVDKRIQYGGCIIEADNGSLDARLESQIQILKESLMSATRKKRLGV